jgi:hypothetical protein
MRRLFKAAPAIAVLALALPATAPATLSEVGIIQSTTPATVASCPSSPCLAVSRTTGFQVKVGTVRSPLSAPKAGSVVAWTVSLGKPSASQIKFFDTNEGGASEAGIAILRAAKKPRLTYKLIATSPPVKLEKYFGKTVQFPLAATIPVRKGDIVALNVPTWAPALALGFGNDTSWRASRQKKGCATTSSQSVQTALGSSLQYYCLYQTARLTYSATLISTP